MAEREGFEPPIPVKVWLISSQLHSTGLCHLSALVSRSVQTAFAVTRPIFVLYQCHHAAKCEANFEVVSPSKIWHTHDSMLYFP